MNKTQFWNAVMATETYKAEFERARVAPEDACPRCGERRQDMLVWAADGRSVVCHECANEYVPSRS